MRQVVTLGLVSFFVGIGTTMAQGDEKEKDRQLQNLQGVWRVRELQLKVPGATQPPQAELQKWRWIIKGNKLTWVYADQKTREESFTLHPERNPKWIDLTNTVRILSNDGGQANEEATEKWTLYGIYHLEGNTLKVCLPVHQTGSNSRPVEITAKSGSGSLVWIFERLEMKK